ncbi:hypothetical protein TNCV_4948651 [Trichonephila clavipes]|nr:hypothetical protein TNCV_4948651 [Trichonephila clavipes]
MRKNEMCCHSFSSLQVVWIVSGPLLDSEKFSFMEVVPSGCSRSGNQIQKCPGVRALTLEESADNGVTSLEFRQTLIWKILLAKLECRTQ